LRSLEGRGRLVVGAAVQLDEHALRWPDAVDLQPLAPDLQPAVGLRPGQLRLVDEAQKAALELAPGDGRPEPLLHRTLEVLRAAAAVMALDQSNQGSPVGEPHCLGPLQHPVELVWLEDGGEVEQGAGDGRDRDAGVDGALVGGDGGFANPHASPRGKPARRADVHGHGPAFEDAPQCRGAAMAEYGVRSTRQHGG
jgi:hypothetical protein